MARAAQDGLRFVPSAVEGRSAVTEVAVFPDRLELLSEDKWVVIRILDIARWYRHGWLYPPAPARLGGARVAVGGGSGLVPPAGGPVLDPAAAHCVHARRAAGDELRADHVPASAGRAGRGWVRYLRPGERE